MKRCASEDGSIPARARNALCVQAARQVVDMAGYYASGHGTGFE